MSELQPGQKVYIVNRERVRKGLGPRSVTIAEPVYITEAGVRKVGSYHLKGGGCAGSSEIYLELDEAKAFARAMARDEARAELKRYEAILARLNEAYKASAAD